MALPTLDSVFASASDLPRRQMLAQWLVNLQYSGSVADYWTLPEHYLWAKIAVAAGAPRSEADYISLPKNYVWSDLYNAVSGSSGQTIDRGEKEAIGWIAAAVRGDAGNPEAVATYINWPWRYQVASIITALAVDSDAQSFIATSGATDVEAIDQFVKEVKDLGLWDSMVCWPLRSSQNAGTGTTAYSLGGLGTYDGTLVNFSSGAWTADGITFDKTLSQYITTTRSFDFNTASTVAAAAKRVSANVSNHRIFGLAGTQATPMYVGTQLTGAIGSWRGSGPTSDPLFAPADNTFNIMTLSTAASTITGTLNSASANQISYTPSAVAGNLNIGATSILLEGSRWDGPIAFAAYMNSAASNAAVAALHSLYKSTLGAGLGLP